MPVKPNAKEAFRTIPGQLIKLHHEWRHDVAVVIGNGTCRKDFDLHRMKDYPFIRTVGCNGIVLHDDFVPDVVALIDGKAVKFCIQHDILGKTITVAGKAHVAANGVTYGLLPREIKWCGKFTGGLGVAIAVSAGCREIYLLGHDLEFGPEHRIHAGKELYPEKAQGASRTVVANWLLFFNQAIAATHRRIAWFEIDNDKLPCETLTEAMFWGRMEIRDLK